MRLLMPSAGTMPGDWIDWRPNISAVFNYDWNDWRTEPDADQTLHTVFALEPCRICQKDVRIPQHNAPNPIESMAECVRRNLHAFGRNSLDGECSWWGRWGPWVFNEPYTSKPGINTQEEDRGGRRMNLPPEASQILGRNRMPDCTDQWRDLMVPLNDVTHTCKMNYRENSQNEFT